MAIGGQGVKDERPRKCGHGALDSLIIVMNPHVIHQQGPKPRFDGHRHARFQAGPDPYEGNQKSRMSATQAAAPAAMKRSV